MDSPMKRLTETELEKIKPVDMDVPWPLTW